MALLLLFASLLTGVIDIHAHCAPDSVPRSIDAIDLAKLAKARGMRGLVLKNHWESTASVAYLVRNEVPGIEVFGGIDLNRSVGGMNPEAVQVRFKEATPFVCADKTGGVSDKGCLEQGGAGRSAPSLWRVRFPL